MEYQDRVNRPLGMSDVDLLIYDKDIYTLFRTHEGLETDAFRYDPIVSAGILASDYAYAQGMAWVNLLTPASQDKINPGDGLIVPVQTYDNYKQNPPIEKYLTHEVSYTANELNLVRAEGLHNEFVGDFNNYFDQESSLIRESVADNEEGTPIPAPTPTTPPRTLFSGVWQPKTITTSIPRGVTESAIPPRTTYNQTYINNLNNSTGTLVELKAKLKLCIDYCKSKNIAHTVHCKKLIDKIKALSISTPVSTTPGGGTASGGSSTSGSSTSGGGTTSGSGTSTGGSSTSGGGGEIIDGGAFPTGGGGGGMVGGGGAPSESPAEETPKTDDTKPKETPKTETAKASEKLDMIPIYIGIAIFGLIGYYYANTQKKDVKTLGLAGGIIGGLLGYFYSKHQQKPIEFISKLGIKSKSESGYFIDEI